MSHALGAKPNLRLWSVVSLLVAVFGASECETTDKRGSPYRPTEH